MPPLRGGRRSTGGTEVNIAFSLGGGAVGAFLTTFILGGILVALAPDYTRQQMETVRTDVIGSFVYGFFWLVLFVLVIVLLVVTIIGVVVAVPLIVLVTLVWAFGAAIAYLAIAERLVDSADGWLGPLLVAAGMNGGLTLTGVGGLVSFCIGAIGFGAVLRNYFE